jgi:uncharacterized spore protein YtfJ
MSEEKREEQDHLSEMFARLEEMQANATVGAVFGQPVTTGDKVVIPVARVSYAFGLGFGEGADQGEAGVGAGGGGGVSAQPLGLVEVTPEQTRVEPIVDEHRVAVAGMALVAWSVFWTAWAVVRILGRGGSKGG